MIEHIERRRCNHCDKVKEVVNNEGAAPFYAWVTVKSQRGKIAVMSSKDMFQNLDFCSTQCCMEYMADRLHKEE